MSQDETTAAATPQEWLRGHATGIADRDGEVSLLNATIRELTVEIEGLRAREARLLDIIRCYNSDDEPNTTAAKREYTREEMREACRNNYNAGAGTTLSR